MFGHKVLWLDKKYVNLVSAQLERFHWKHHDVAACRCPLCGDSTRVQSKTRMYLYPHNGQYMAKCHNCFVALPFPALLRRLSPRLYHEYLLELLKERGRPAAASPPVEPLRPTEVRSGRTTSMLVRPLHVLPPTNATRAYVEGRHVSPDVLYRLYETTNCRTWLTPLVGADKATRVSDGIPYLVLPLFTVDGDWYGCQVRALTEKVYVTFRWATDDVYGTIKVFGLESWSPKQITYIVEGPMDSLFVPNAVAMCGSDLYGGCVLLEQVGIFTHTTERVFVFDNEPRNIEVVRLMRNVIRLHESIFIWPKGYPKDINDVWTAQQHMGFLDVLRRRTFRGLRAELEFATWRG